MASYTDEQLQAAAQRVANVYARIANRSIAKCNIPVPVPLYFNLEDTKPTWAGAAHSDMRVGINSILMRENVIEMLNETIPHEIGHLVQYQVFDLKGTKTPGHGPEWQACMVKFGKKPTKTHSMNVANAVKHYREKKREAKKIKTSEGV